MAGFHVRIVTPAGLYQEFDANSLNLPAQEGRRGVLVNHMPLVTMLKAGMLTAKTENEEKTFEIEKGLFYFRKNVAEIFTDTIKEVV